MLLDVVENFSNGKWLGLFQDGRTEPPAVGEILKTRTHGRLRVKSCIQQKHNGKPVNSYRIVVKRM